MTGSYNSRPDFVAKHAGQVELRHNHQTRVNLVAVQLDLGALRSLASA